VHAAGFCLNGTGVTVNVLVLAGITNAPMVSESGFDRAKMIQPEVMVPPLLWLVSDAAGKVTGRRFLGVHWDPALSPSPDGKMHLSHLEERMFARAGH
jgi:hypothetical protein